MAKLSRRRVLKSGMCAAVAGFTGLGYARWDTQALEFIEHHVELDRWTEDGFRLAYLCDSHLTDAEAARITRTAVEWAIAQQPDVIVFGGDFVESSLPGALERMQDAFAPITSSTIPACAVLGNHDYAVFHPERIDVVAHRLGFRILKNEPFKVGNVTIFGLDCWTFGRCRPELVAPYTSRENLLVVAHEPDVVDDVPQGGSLMLAGHSHGGQICLPFGIPIHTPIGSRKYKSGPYPNAPTPLYVSRGLGVTEIKSRLFCRPEVTLFTFHSSSGQRTL